MNSTPGCAIVLATLGILALNSRANTTTLHFDDLKNVLPDWGIIPDTYGDNKPNTPDVTVDYRTFLLGGATLVPYVEFWHDNYGDLHNVAFPTQNGYMGEVSLVPSPGHTVTLQTFALGGYSHADQFGQTVRILDANYNVLLDYSPFNVEGDSGHSSFAPNITSKGALRIQWGPSWNSGLDNVTFCQDTIVPDAGSSLALLALASTTLAFARRSRR